MQHDTNLRKTLSNLYFTNECI